MSIQENIEINLDQKWIDGRKFEEFLCASPLLKNQIVNRIDIIIHEGCAIMVDTAVRLLSYINQLNNQNIQVCLNFLQGEEGAYGYLDRIGFFEYVDEEIIILPERPSISKSEIFHGENPGVFEIVTIDPSQRDENLPSLLTDRLLENINFIENISAFEQALFTVFSELLDNIYLHSNTKLNGYLAFQAYRNRENVKVAVSDSGIGIIETLRPSISKLYPKYKDLSDADIIYKIFTEGLSRDGKDKGCGLKSCASHALKFNAKLDLRLPHAQFLLTPYRKAFARAIIDDSIVNMLGTHITFDFRLDNN